MKILVVCDHGNNRSVTLAGQLKYWGHDVIPVGIQTNSAATLEMLIAWADRVIFTEDTQVIAGDRPSLPDKFQLWDLGPDVYPRPYNKELLAKVKVLMDEHKWEYKHEAN